MNRFRYLILTISVVLITAYAMAVPAQPNKIEFEQPNGYILTINLFGDEFVHWSQTTDDYTVLQNKDGYYVYAIQDNKGDLTMSDQIAHNLQDRNSIELSFLSEVSKKLRFSKDQIKITMQRWGGKKGLEKRGGFPTTGTNNLIMILANFSDTDATFTQDGFNNYMNEENYNGTGSFKDYYMEVSYGQLIVNTTVTVWVTLPHTHDYYGPQDKWQQFAIDAVNAAAPYVDYSNFDNDNDGEVDGVAIIHQGRGQEATSNTNDIWSHSSSIWNYVTHNGVQISAYTTQPELSSNYTMATIGVMCHEFGHNLGAPDYYDTNYEENGSYDGTGNWDIMAGGSYNNNGKNPAHHNPYTKWEYYGWITPTLISTEQEVTMENSAENSTGFYYYTTPTSGEYWLMENRQKIGFDSYVPGHGLLIFHIDESHINTNDWGNTINIGSHQGVYPVCAFASSNPPGNYGNINSPSTPFPGVFNNTEFTDNTTPSSTSWAGSGTGKPITNIQETGTTISFTFMADVLIASITVKNSETNQTISNAAVTIGTQTKTTNSEGVSEFTLQDGDYDYTVTKYGFDDASGSLTINGSDVEIDVNIDPVLMQYTATFNVKDDILSLPIENAEISINNTTVYSNANGIGIASLTNGSYEYIITKNGFEDYTASLSISNSNTTRNITMTAYLYEVSFSAYNGDTPLSGVNIEIAETTITTDANGNATIDLPSGTHAFTASLTGFGDYTGECVVDGATETISISMVGANDIYVTAANIYPNPASDILHIEMDGNYTVTIFNAIGNSIMNLNGANHSQIDINELPAGVYFLKTNNNNNSSMTRFVVNR